ncbi:uncharacterized protein EI90DRAFT_780048 [Cantharellus anzutake]|uniref:uncharacterized protein n=1 Tax=Cantharellus anzutake TaxID=1750568 RepID=UPI0019081E52|nr:uncharacterized protein EI90DRAFT_780048 [Cantharellus anzutake]KAF8342730.1 hypothetical protein EI90DRAFT_780048 [Cantharellus anzutake]
MTMNTPSSWGQEVAGSEQHRDPGPASTPAPKKRKTVPKNVKNKSGKNARFERPVETNTQPKVASVPSSVPLPEPPARTRVAPPRPTSSPTHSPKPPTLVRPADASTVVRYLIDPEQSAGAQPNASPLGRELPSSIRVALDHDQSVAVTSICNGDATPSTPVVRMVAGPAGSGKSRVITAAVQWLCSGSSSEPSTCYIVTRDDSGIFGLARNFQLNGFEDFKAIISGETDLVKSTP